MAAVVDDFSKEGISPTVPQQNAHITMQPQGQESRSPDEGSAPKPDSELDWGESDSITHSGRGHSGRRPTDCPKCGQEVARLLCEQLSFARTGKDSKFTPQYSFSDVMILTRHNSLTNLSHFIRALREANVPVRVMLEEMDLALCKESKNSAVAAWEGLVPAPNIRPIVVFLHTQPPGAKTRSVTDDEKTLAILREGKVQHIILVQPPRPRKCDEEFEWTVPDYKLRPGVSTTTGYGQTINTAGGTHYYCDDCCADCLTCFSLGGTCCDRHSNSSSDGNCDCDCGSCDCDCGSCDCSGDCVIM